MKYLILTVVTFSLFIACNSSHKEETVIEMGNNKESESIELCDCDDLVENEQKELMLNDQIYTGNCFLDYPQSDQKYIEKQILNGKVHGKIIYFDKQGNVLFEETYNEGVLLGDLDNKSTCSCAELTVKKSDDVTKNYLNDILYTGSCEDYFPDTDQLYLESNYKNGLLNGFTIYYQKDGSVLMMQDYKDGILIEDIIPQ